MKIKENIKKFKVYNDMNYSFLGFKKIIKNCFIGTIRRMYDGNFGFQPAESFIFNRKELERISNKLKNLNK